MIFSHWWTFINHLLLQTPWTTVIEKTEGLFQSHNGVCFSKAETISRIFKEKGQSLCQISLDHQNMKERIMSLNTVHMYTSSLALTLSNTHTHTHTHTHRHTQTHTYFYCPVLCQPVQYFRPKWGELRERKIHIEVRKHSRKKKTDLFKSTNTPNKSWWAWWGDCSSFWQLCNYSLNTATTFFGNRHSICKTITARGITSGQSPGYICHNPLGRR